MKAFKRRQELASIEISEKLDSCENEKIFSDMRRRQQYIEEWTETFLTNSKNLASGGHVEGTSIQGSDSDVMNIIQGVSVIETDGQVSNEYVILLMSPEGSSPGYVKLEVKKLDWSLKRLQTDTYGSLFVSNIETLIMKIGNKSYLSSEYFKEVVKVDGFTSPDSFTETGITVSGPAVKNKTLLGEIDYVVALECHRWPKSAVDWLIRPRKHSWPSARFLKRLKKDVNCYVVPTGDEHSPDNKLQWRLSFVAIERELMWHMNDIQLKCYISLKILLKKIEHELPDNGLKTYHLKNTMFWFCEESAVDIWKEHMLMPRINDCLKKLIQYVKHRNLPQYVLPENNLLKNRLTTNGDIQRTIACLEQGSKDVLQTVRAYHPGHSFPRNFKKFSPSRYKDILEIESNKEIYGFIRYISRYTDVSKIKEYAEVFPKRFPDFKEFSPCINVALANAMYIDKVKSGDTVEETRVDIDRYLEHASTVDVLTSCLYRALFDFHDRKYKAAKKNIEKHHMDLRSARLNYFELNDTDNCYAPNVIVLEQVLKGSRWFLKINSKVLAYLLQFLSQHLLGQTTESHRTVRILSSIVDGTMDNVQPFAHLNILGYCYTLLGQYDRAIRTFCKSLSIFPSVANAAVYHLAFMINRSNLVCH